MSAGASCIRAPHCTCACLFLQGRNTIPPQQPAASVELGVRPAALPPVSSRSRGASGSEAASLWAPASSGGAATQQRGNALLLSSLGVPGAGSSSSSSNAAPRQLAIHVDEEFGPSGGLWLDSLFLKQLTAKHTIAVCARPLFKACHL